MMYFSHINYEEEYMTQKELLYLEDAIGHEKSIVDICNSIENNLSDEKLKEFISNCGNIHQTRKERLENFLEEKANE